MSGYTTGTGPPWNRISRACFCGTTVQGLVLCLFTFEASVKKNQGPFWWHCHVCVSVRHSTHNLSTINGQEKVLRTGGPEICESRLRRAVVLVPEAAAAGSSGTSLIANWSHVWVKQAQINYPCPHLWGLLHLSGTAVVLRGVISSVEERKKWEKKWQRVWER